ncbi:tripartite tricarboxylate transporter substrate binding protein [Bordetella petrii]|nr:tripartite tricarboxylate transporter substrate binding protein [Bordetella petrii]
MRYISWALALLLSAALAAPAIAAQDFPTKPVRLIVPQTPGGASDTLARTIAQKLSEQWKQTVVVENRAGAGGNVGMEAVLNAPADGYTLLMSYVGTQAINGALYKNLPFDPGTDFAPVATLATLPFVLITRPDAPFKSVDDLVQAAKKGRITYGSAGNGSVNHLLGEMFSSAANVPLQHVPYRGAAAALQDLLGGRIDIVFTSLPSVAGAIKGGTVRPLAVTSARRAESFADIPTIAEAGFKSFDVNPWFGLMAPKDTPPELITRINRDVNAALQDPKVVESFAGKGAEPYATSPAEFAKVLAADVQRWGDVVRASGAQVD